MNFDLTMLMCPHCKGSKTIDMTIPFFDVISNIPKNDVVKCWTCYGEGVVTRLQLAVFKARGGPSPLPMRGF